jgi:flagellar motor protein MotB
MPAAARLATYTAGFYAARRPGNDRHYSGRVAADPSEKEITMKTVRMVAALCCGTVGLALVGCGPGPKDMQVEAMQAEINRLNAEKQDLLARLAQAQRERDDALARLRDAQAQIAALQAQPQAPVMTTPAQPGWTERGPIAWTDISDTILFDSGKADLKAGGRDELQRVLGEARQNYPDRQIWIVGHTDTDPIKHSKWKDNLELSVQRACTVFREMQKMGVDPTNMVAAGHGEYGPKAPNDTRANKQLNRRVQIVAIEVPAEMRGLIREAPPGEQG